MSQVGRSISFITGASRGFGRAICEAISSKTPAYTGTFVITGRNEEELEVTSKLIKDRNAGVTVIKKVYDFKSRDSTKFNQFINELYSLVTEEFSSLTFYHNAATLGPLAYIGVDLDEPLDSMYDDEFHVNCSACFTLTSNLINK